MTTETYRLAYPKASVRSAVSRAISELGWQKKEEFEDKLTATASSTLWSWGESIEVILSSKDNGTLLTITSNPKLQLFDWGKGKENIQLLIDSISETLARR